MIFVRHVEVELFILLICNEKFFLVFRESISSYEHAKLLVAGGGTTAGVPFNAGWDRVTLFPLLFCQSFPTDGRFSELSLSVYVFTWNNYDTLLLNCYTLCVNNRSKIVHTELRCVLERKSIQNANRITFHLMLKVPLDVSTRLK